MSIDSERDVEALKRVGRVVALALRAMRQGVREGITTGELDEIGARVLAEHDARSAPQMIYDFPRATCISVNDEAVHGVPGPRILRPGDLVTLDVTAEQGGYFADAAITVAVPPVAPLGRRLMECAQAALGKAIRSARAGAPLSAIGGAVETEVRRRGFRVLRELCGHGIGRSIHEEPSVLNYFDRRSSERLSEGAGNHHRAADLRELRAHPHSRGPVDDPERRRESCGALRAHHHHHPKPSADSHRGLSGKRVCPSRTAFAAAAQYWVSLLLAVDYPLDGICLICYIKRMKATTEANYLGRIEQKRTSRPFRRKCSG